MVEWIELCALKHFQFRIFRNFIPNIEISFLTVILLCTSTNLFGFYNSELNLFNIEKLKFFQFLALTLAAEILFYLFYIYLHKEGNMQIIPCE